jgi:predicted CoA-binding protein
MLPSDTDLQNWLRQSRTIAVVGISNDPSKPSHYVSAYMQQRGYTIVPVNPKYALRGEQVLGQTCYARLTDIPPDIGRVDIVNCFRQTADIVPIAQDAVAIGAKGLWQQVGIDNQVAIDLATQAGLWCVSNACLMVEHRRRLT